MSNKKYTPEEKKRILELYRDGWTYTMIAEKIRPGVKSAWRTVGEIVRRSKSKTDTATPSRGMSADLPKDLADSLTAKHIMSMLDEDMKEIFLSTYESLKNEADEDSINKSERESLLRAALVQTEYLHASKMYRTCERYMMQELNGELDDDDRETKAKKRLAGRSDIYKKEMEAKHKEYMELLDSLKLTRRQRLDKVKDTKNTLLDVINDLSQKARPESIIDDIKRINTATKKEFYRMAQGHEGPDGKRHPWLIGAFDDVQDEQP